MPRQLHCGDGPPPAPRHEDAVLDHRGTADEADEAPDVLPEPGIRLNAPKIVENDLCRVRSVPLLRCLLVVLFC